MNATLLTILLMMPIAAGLIYILGDANRSLNIWVPVVSHHHDETPRRGLTQK